MIGIYKITSPNNKIYIGRSIDIEKRFKQYKTFNKSNNSQIKLIRSFNKYGIENHIFEIIEECIFEDLNIKERYWQDYYNVISEHGLNLVLTRTDEKPTVFSKETRDKMSLAHKGKKKKPFTKQHIENLSKSHKGKIFSNETKLKMSKSCLRKNSKILISLNTGIFYNSFKEAALIYNIKRTTLNAMLRGQLKNKTDLIYCDE
jgi:group I intron endonuclease